MKFEIPGASSEKKMKKWVEKLYSGVNLPDDFQVAANLLGIFVGVSVGLSGEYFSEIHRFWRTSSGSVSSVVGTISFMWNQFCERRDTFSYTVVIISRRLQVFILQKLTTVTNIHCHSDEAFLHFAHLSSSCSVGLLQSSHTVHER